MSTVTTIEVVDLLTIRECIEILVDRRTGHDRTPSLPPAVVDYLGADQRHSRIVSIRTAGQQVAAGDRATGGCRGPLAIRAHPSVCDPRSGQLTGYQNVAPHESNLPYLRRIKAAGRMKPTDSTGSRLRPRAQQRAGGAKYVWNNLVRSRQRHPSIHSPRGSQPAASSPSSNGAAGSGACHPNSAELPPGQCAERHP